MTILQWNMCGYRNRYPDLCRIITDISPGCICLQETMLGAYVPKPPRSYSIITHPLDADPIPGRGLATLVHSSLSFTRIDVESEHQVLTVRIGFSQLITVCNIYISPQEQIRRQSIMHIINQLPPPFILVGDFNCKHPLWGDPLTDARGRILEDIIQSEDISLLNTGSFTHFHSQTGTSHAIDLSLCSPELILSHQWKTLDDFYGSDHTPIQIDEIENNTLPDKPTKYNTRKAKWQDFENATSTPVELTDLPIDEEIDKFTNIIYNAAENTIPMTSPINRVKCVPWWTQECTQLNLERKRALRRYQRSRLPADKIIFQRARARSQYFIRKIKKESWKQYISSINIKTPMSKVWTKIRKMTGRYPPNHPPCISMGNRTISDRPTVSRLLAEHYSSVSSSENYSANFNRSRVRQELLPLNFHPTNNEPYNEPITMGELIGALRTYQDSAPGEDLITYSMIKHLHPTSQNFLLHIINKIWLEGVFPANWRRAIVLPFLKPGKDPSQTSSYRPIALTSCICKLTEKIVNTRLTRVLESRNIISNLQFGFRKHKSTIDALLRLQTDILDCFSRKEHMVALFFDIQKAYDTAWKHGIMKMIHDANIKGPLALFIQNFLQERVFRTRIGSTLSHDVPQEQGVPQGSVLSCTLFLLAINDLLSDMPHHIKASLYVDDLVIYTSSNHIPSIERRLQLAINRVQAKATNRGFRFSQQKSIAVHFHRKRGLQQEPSLFLYGEPVQFRDSIRYLGLIFDQRLRWKKHIDALKIKCTKSLDILKCLSRTKWGGDRTTLLRLYRSLIRSKLDYGSFIYWTASKNVLKKLDPVHNAGIRLCIGAFKSSPVESLYAESGEQSLYHRRQQLALQYYSRSFQTPDSPVYGYIHNHNQDQMRTDTETFAEYMGTILQTLNAPEISGMPVEHLNDPVWLIPSLLCKDFNPPKKNDINVRAMRRLFHAHTTEKHPNAVHIFTDGSKQDESVGCAIVTRNFELSRKLQSESSIFTAELLAVYDAAVYVRDSPTEGSFVVFSDSQSAIMSVESYNSSHPIVCKILSVILEIINQPKSICICWVPGHTGVEGNELADSAANRAAVSQQRPHNQVLPFKDYFPLFRKLIKSHWQNEWFGIQNNKLRKIKDNVSPWSSSTQSNRHHEVILCRLRIGHTLFSHGHLMERRPLPYCEDCLVPITVYHIIAECPSNRPARTRYFPTTNGVDNYDEVMAIILGNNNITPLISYLSDINILNQI